MLEPDRDQIEIFFDALFRHATPGAFLSLRSFFEDRGVGKPFFIIPAKLNGDFKLLCTLTANAARHAANAADKIVFAPPICAFHNGRGATEADIAEGLVLSVECDSHPQRGRDKLENLIGPATIITRSGGRWRDPETGELHDKIAFALALGGNGRRQENASQAQTRARSRLPYHRRRPERQVRCPPLSLAGFMAP